LIFREAAKANPIHLLKVVEQISRATSSQTTIHKPLRLCDFAFFHTGLSAFVPLCETFPISDLTLIHLDR